MLTECFSIKVRFARKPRKIEQARISIHNKVIGSIDPKSRSQFHIPRPTLTPIPTLTRNSPEPSAAQLISNVKTLSQVTYSPPTVPYRNRRPSRRRKRLNNKRNQLLLQALANGTGW